jgi:hypothetical protein
MYARGAKKYKKWGAAQRQKRSMVGGEKAGDEQIGQYIRLVAGNFYFCGRSARAKNEG